jgi:hypothetical protein
MYSAATWKSSLETWMNSQNSPSEYFYVTHEATEGTTRNWTYIVERQAYDFTTAVWIPRRKCLVVSIRPQTSNTHLDDFAEIAAQDASNIARNTPNLSFFVGDQVHLHGYRVNIVEGDLTVEKLHAYGNLPSGQNLGAYLKTLAISNDDIMKAFGN